MPNEAQELGFPEDPDDVSDDDYGPDNSEFDDEEDDDSDLELGGI